MYLESSSLRNYSVIIGTYFVFVSEQEGEERLGYLRPKKNVQFTFHFFYNFSKIPSMELLAKASKIVPLTGAGTYLENFLSHV